jgi:hypothetical protein
MHPFAPYESRRATSGPHFWVFPTGEIAQPSPPRKCDNLFLMRMNSADDLARLEELFSFVPSGLLARAPTFGLGQALVAGALPSPDAGADWRAHHAGRWRRPASQLGPPRSLNLQVLDGSLMRAPQSLCSIGAGAGSRPQPDRAKPPPDSNGGPRPGAGLRPTTATRCRRPRKERHSTLGAETSKADSEGVALGGPRGGGLSTALLALSAA